MEEKNKELKELLDLVISAFNAGIQAKKDGKIDMGDLGLVLSLIPKIEPAFEGVSAIPAELSSMTEEDAADIVSFVMSKLVIEEEKAKDIVSKSLHVLFSAYALIKSF